MTESLRVNRPLLVTVKNKVSDTHQRMMDQSGISNMQVDNTVRPLANSVNFIRRDGHRYL